MTPEYKVGSGWADYALLRPDGKPAATVEAKKLGEALASHRMQMLTYANASGIDYAGLTDGNHWELYDVFKRGQLEERRMLKVSIANDPAHESALKLLLLWRPNLESGQQLVPANKPILRDARRPTPKPAVVEEVPAPRPESPDWVVLSEYNPPTGTPCPASIRFWDGSERKLEHWYEILTFVVEKLYTEGRLTDENIPVPSGSKRHIVHTKSVHPTDKPFTSCKSIDGTPLFVEVHLSAPDIRQNSQNLLQSFGPNPVAVYLQAAK